MEEAKDGGVKLRVFTVLCALTALVLTSCGTAQDETVSDDLSVEVIKTAYRNIQRRYVSDVMIDSVSMAGLRAVTRLDPALRIDRASGAVILELNEISIGQWPTPADDDGDGWARLSNNAIETALRSPALGGQEKDGVLKAFFKGGLSGLDRYTRYETPQEARNTRARREGFGGLGITIRYDEGKTYVRRVHAGTPAFVAGLKRGDLITHVGETPLAGLDQRAIIQQLRGPVHSAAVLTVERRDETAPRKITVVRAHIIIPTVTSEFTGEILRIRITGFNQGTARSLGRELATAEREAGDDLKGIVLDLRSNPGGLLDQAVAVADFFLNDGRIISTRGRHSRANQKFDASWGERMRSVPIAVLVNGRSASASEIVAAALRDRGRAIVIGASSFGKGSVQTIIPLPNGGELTMTWAHMIAPSGFNLHQHGVIPAVCTATADETLSDITNAIRQSTGRAPSVLGRVLELRHAVRTNPEKARADCPPSNKELAEDIEISEYILKRKALYGRTLSNGGPAIAEQKK